MSVVRSLIIMTNLPIDALHVRENKIYNFSDTLKATKIILRSLFAQIFHAILVAVLVLSMPAREI